MKFFDDVERTNAGFDRRTESTFDFLNRSARADISATRETVEAMFAGFPDSDKADLRGRFRSSDEAHSGAFFELFLYTVLRKAGWEVSVHPPGGASNTHRVDFQIQANGKRIFLEARALVPRHGSTLRDRLLAPVLDAVDDIESPDFFLQVKVEGNLRKAIAGGPIKKHLTGWLKGLDYSKVLAETAGKDGDRNCPRTEREQDGCKLEFVAWPKRKVRGKPGRAIGIGPWSSFRDNTGQRLRKILSEKARRYGKLDTPYIIAVNVMDGFEDDECVLEALFGKEAVQIRTYDDGHEETWIIRQLNGLWRQHGGARYTRVSAVLVASRLRPWCMPQSRLTLYLNPWAEHPLPDEFSMFEVVRLDSDGHLKREGEPTLPSTLCP